MSRSWIKRITLLIVLFMVTGARSLWGQDSVATKKDSVPVVDIGDIIKKIFKKEKKAKDTSKPGGLAILPSLGYNPSFGFIIGAKLSGGLQIGDPVNTNYSVISLEGMYTSKGIISVQARHNIFIAHNRWNWQGQWQIAHYGLVDYGVGTGYSKYESRGLGINEYPTKNADSAFPIDYSYIRLSEKGYRKIGKYFYAGGGIRLDIYRKIDDEKQTNNFNTPHQRYSLRHDFNPDEYSANGFIVAVQYNTREHPIRSYGGIYADLGLQVNQEWMGSTKNAVQLSYDFRKYWSLSKKNPEHVLAIWHWAVYKLSGELPYLEMPCTASDPYGRSGRGYTFSRFKGPSYAYFETEWRFPITRNKLISGVTFFNLQTASNDFNRGVFNAWEPGAGAGLRFLFQKHSRTTLSADWGQGKYGSQGVFFGLGEVF